MNRGASVMDLDRLVAEALDQAMENERNEWNPLPHQVPPKGKWYGWLLNAGRGAGKTDTCAKYVSDHVKGPACLPGPVPHWIGVIAPTLGDAATACYSGPSGIRAHDPDAKLIGGAIGGAAIKWPNGSEAKLFGAHTPEDAERLRAGGNRCLVWAEELAAWRYLDDCWDQMTFGLRVGPRPHWVASTTPKPRKLIKKLIKGTIANVIVTRASTYDNPHLPQSIRDVYVDRYAGTSLGAQELEGSLIDQDENALWRVTDLDDNRVAEIPEDLIKISIGVDPSGGAGEQGIVAVGKQELWVPADSTGSQVPAPLEGSSRVRAKKELHGYVLGDYSCRLGPAGWGRRAVQCAIDFEADDIVVETNFGGDMAIAVIKGAADAMDVNIPVRTVRASRGKRVRAEPVSALSTRGRWHHVGRFEELEDQMTTWTEDSGYSPDRLDAAVWPAWHTKLVGTNLRAVGSFGGGEMNRSIG